MPNDSTLSSDSLSAPQQEATAGRELDMLVAEKVMGWGWVARMGSKWFAPLSMIGTDRDPIYGVVREPSLTDAAENPWWLNDSVSSGEMQFVPHYSTDIAAAWLVVEHWRKRGDGFQLDSLGFDGAEWRCGFMNASNGGMEIDFAEGSTAPLAICLAALAASAALKSLEASP